MKKAKLRLVVEIEPDGFRGPIAWNFTIKNPGNAYGRRIVRSGRGSPETVMECIQEALRQALMNEGQ